jgi:hypothetical protein
VLNVITDLETRRFKKPKEWDRDTPCQEISIIDIEVPVGDQMVKFMTTMWKPTPEELSTLVRGGFLRLGISGERHPVMFMDFIDPEHINSEPPT